MTTAVLISFLAVLGLLVGSFLNVVIVRVPAGDSIVSPPSHCPLCETPIRPRDNIPVISWLLLRGRCRSCSEPIPAGYPLVELTNAVLWVLAGLRFGATWPVIAYALLFSALLALSVIDLELYLLPNRITYPLLTTSAIAVIPLSLTQDDPLGKVIGAWGTGIAYTAVLVIPAVILSSVLGRRALGGGDVKLAPSLGIWLGWLHPYLLTYGIIIAAGTGILAGIIMWAVRRERAEIPFGPWLSLGTIVTILLSVQILDPFPITTP